MSAIPASDSPDERPARTTRHERESDPDTAVPEWAPVEPLPSSEMFLEAFAGVRPVAARDILDPAFDLVACHCEERLAEAILTSQAATLEELRVAGKSLVSARTDIAMLVTVIDAAVRQRLLWHRRDHPALPMPSVAPDGGSRVPVHTESVEEIAARMAELWEALGRPTTDLEELPEAQLLAKLCDGYDGLAAEIEAGRRLPPGW